MHTFPRFICRCNPGATFLAPSLMPSFSWQGFKTLNTLPWGFSQSKDHRKHRCFCPCVLILLGSAMPLLEGPYSSVPWPWRPARTSRLCDSSRMAHLLAAVFPRCFSLLRILLYSERRRLLVPSIHSAILLSILLHVGVCVPFTPFSPPR